MITWLRMTWFVVLDALLIAAFMRGQMMIPDWFVLGMIGFVAVLVVTDARSLYLARRSARTDSKETTCP